MDRREPPHTEEGWYVLHDLRRIRWDDWRAASEADRETAIEAGTAYLDETAAVRDADAGGSAAFSIVGHKADLLLVHLRPTLAAIDRLERQFEQTALARYTDQPTSYVSITEVSGYTTDISEGLDQVADAGLRNYLETRLHPRIPDAAHVSFYPMDKRREPEYNWYDLPFDERADLMASHGEIGRDYAGDVTQIISGSIGLDDYEWGVTLFADDLTAVKHLLAEMRFDPSSSRYAEFGPFYVGSRMAPDDLPALLAGETVPADADAAPTSGSDGPPAAPAAIDARLQELGVDPAEWGGHHALVYEADAAVETLREEVDALRANFDHYDRHVHTSVETGPDGTVAVVSVWTAAEAADTAGGFLADLPGIDHQHDGPVEGSPGDDGDADIREALSDLGIYGGQPHGEDVYALVSFTDADEPTLTDAVADLRATFAANEAHVKTAIYREHDGDRTAVASIWATDAAAAEAGRQLAALPGVDPAADREPDGFATMGMFYTVEPAHRAAFVDRFADVGALLADMDGHRETTLFVNVDDENDTFIDSRWDDREDAMAFFRSDAFAETVSFGRDVLAERPRHVFLA